MLRNRNIAFFIDVDNVGLSSENYDNILAQLDGMGTILMGKIYGAKERKHKDIYQSAEVKGYKVERPMRIKRRGRKDFDSRIFIDVVDAVCKAPAIDAVCVITASCDLVYLYSYLHGKGIKFISSKENEAASAEMVDEIVDLGRVYEIVLPVSKPRTAKPKVKQTVAKTVVKKAVKPVRETVVEQEAKDDNTDELLAEIERLRSLTESQQAEKEAHSKSLEEAKRKAYEEAKRDAEKEAIAKIRAEEEAKKKAEAEKAARDKAIEEARAKAYEEARREAEKEAIAKVKAEEEARKKAEAEAKKTAEEIERIRAEREALEEKEAQTLAKLEKEAKAREEQAEKARQEAIEEARKKAYEEARAKAYEEAKRDAEKEAQAKVNAEAEAKRKAIEEAERIRNEAAARQKAYEEAKAREEELNRKIAELEARRVEEQNAKNDENADELLREIEKLKRLTSETHQLVKEIKEEGAAPRETIVEKIIYEPARAEATAAPAAAYAATAEEVEEEPVEEKQEPVERKVVETTTEVTTTRTPGEPTTRIEVQVPITDENGETTYSAPRAYYVPQNDSTLIRKIEEIQNKADDSDSDELLEEIRKLLEGLD